MSKIGKEPIIILKGVEITVSGTTVTVKGPKGTLTIEVMDGIELKIENDILVVSLSGKLKEKNNFHGLYRALIQNMVTGVVNGFKKELELKGVGYRGLSSR